MTEGVVRWGDEWACSDGGRGVVTVDGRGGVT